MNSLESKLVFKTRRLDFIVMMYLFTFRYERPDMCSVGTQTRLFFEDRSCISTQTDDFEVQCLTYFCRLGKMK